MDFYPTASGQERSFDDSFVSDCSSSSSLDESDLRPEYFHSDSLLICDDSWDDLPDTSYSNDFGHIIRCRRGTDSTASQTIFSAENIRKDDGFCNTLGNCDVTFLVGPLQQPVHSTKSIIERRCSGLYKRIISQEERVQRQHLQAKRKGRGFLKIFRFFKRRIRSQQFPMSSIQILQEPIVIHVPEFESDVFGSLINFIHTGEITVNSSNALGVLAAAEKYGLHGLSAVCASFMGSSRSISAVHDQNESGSDYMGSGLVTRFPYTDDCRLTSTSQQIEELLNWKALSGNENYTPDISQYGCQERKLSSSSNNSNSAVSLESGYNSGEVDNVL